MIFGLEINLPNGNYYIHVFDDKRELCDIYRNFTVGNIYKGEKEIAIHNPRAFLVLRFSAIPMIIFLFIIIFPYDFNLNIKRIEKIERYIGNKKIKYNNQNIFSMYFWIIILSPFIIRNRILKLDKWLRNLLFFLSIYPIFLPLYFFDRIYGKISFAFNVFMVIGNTIQYENWAMEITYSFYLFIIIPGIFYLSSISFKKIRIIYIINCLFYGFLSTCAIIINFTLLAQSTTFEYLFFTPYFISFIIIIIIIIKLSFEKQKQVEDKEEELKEMIEK